MPTTLPGAAWLRWIFPVHAGLFFWYHQFDRRRPPVGEIGLNIVMGSSTARTVVIVEDEPDTAEMFAEMARLVGFQVYKSLGGVRAIDLIADKKPTVVLLDLMMPDLSGMEVLRYMRRDPRLIRIPVVIVSAKGLPADIKTGLDAGASFYLTKPVAFADLKYALETVQSQAADSTAV